MTTFALIASPNNVDPTAASPLAIEIHTDEDSDYPLGLINSDHLVPAVIYGDMVIYTKTLLAQTPPDTVPTATAFFDKLSTLITQGRTRDRVYSDTYSQLVIAGHNRTGLTDNSEFYDDFYQVIEAAPGVILK